jgi:hypothetical protein
LIEDMGTGWEDIMMWGLRKLKSRKMKATLCRLSWSAAVCNIWKQRNVIKHGNQIRSAERIVMQMKWEVRSSVMAKRKFGRTEENEKLLVLLDLYIWLYRKEQSIWCKLHIAVCS